MLIFIVQRYRHFPPDRWRATKQERERAVHFKAPPMERKKQLQKKELRRIYRAKRLAMSDKEHEEKSTQIRLEFERQFDLRGKTVSIFLPIEKLREINTLPLLEMTQVRFALPVVQEGYKLKHLLYETPQQIVLSDAGIPEPAFGEEVSPSSIDFVVVPLLLADVRGHRVGYGKGYYDRFLASCSDDCQRVGWSFFEPTFPIADVAPHDIRLDYCITPHRVHTFERIVHRDSDRCCWSLD